MCLFLPLKTLDTWIDATEGEVFGGKETVRTALRRGGDQDTVSLSINKAREMVAGLEYLEAKANLASAAARKLDQWSGEYSQADSLHNQVVRGTMTKASALNLLDYLIAENEQTFWLFYHYLTKEPLNDEFEGVEMLCGRGSFSQATDDANVSEAFREGRTQDIRAGLRTVKPRIITKVSDLLFFENKFNHLMSLYTTIKGLK